MNGSGDEAQDALEAHVQAQAIPRQGDANGEPAPVELGALRDANQMGSSENQPSSDARVTAPDTGREVHNPLGFPPNEPQGCTDGLVIPAPGFTSAFYYDPYVEIKDFLDALKSGVNFRVEAAGQEDQSGSVENGTAARQQNEILSESHSGVLNEEPQVPTSQPDSAMLEAYDTNPAMISAESDNIRALGAENAVDSDSKVTQLSSAAEAKSSADNGKAIAETPPTAALASDPNEDAPGRERSSSSSKAAESPPEYTAASHELETVSKEGNTPRDDDTQEHCGSLEQQQRIQSTGANQHTSTAAPVRSSHSQPLGFVASLTASFAPETKFAWAQLFGSKYEDEIGPKSAARLSSSASHDDDDLDQSEEKDNLSEGRLSLKAKLDRERKLDQQIQASQQKFKERSFRKASTTRQQQQSPKRQGISCSTASMPFKPFETAGLSITNVRFCVEKALQATCKCFQQLHAPALNEPRIPKTEAEHGVFVSQWELEQLLQDLFGPPRQEDTKTTTSLSHLSCFALADPQFAGVPLELLLQVTWFIPFDQLTRLRSLVLQITRKHLNEHKLAVLNRHLQKQLLLTPYSTKLQQVLLQFSGHRPRHNKYDPDDDDVEEKENSLVSTAPPLVNCTAHLVHDLLECIAVPVQAELVTALGDKDFLLLSPFELVQKWRLSSLLCIQRVIFFRFLVEAIASERASPTPTTTSSNGNLQTAHRRELSRSASQSVRSVQSRTKAPATIVPRAFVKQKAKTKKKRKSVKPSQSASSVSGKSESESERSEKLRISKASVVGTEGSTTSLLSNNNDDHTGKISSSGTRTKQQQLQSLQRNLLAGLNRLEKVMPWLLRSDESGSSAIRATYLAASAFHQSLEIMIKSHLALDCDIMDKLQHFIEAIGALTTAAAHAALPSGPPTSASRSRMPLPHPAVAAATTVVPSGGDGSSSRLEEFPPPFPDLTKEQEKARFPPPYEASGTSYWAFKPDLPQPSATAGSVTKPSVIHPTLYPAHPSPGVSAYDIQRSDRATFQQKPGHSFRKAGISGGVNGVGTPTPSNDSAMSLSSTPSKPRIYKGSVSVCQSSSPAVVALPSHNSPKSSDRESPRHSVEVEVESRARPESQYDNDDDDERLEVDILNALRRQHNMVVNDFTQDILLQHHREEHQPPQLPPSYNSPVSSSPVKANATTHSRKATTAVEAHEPMWKTSTSESRFVSRIRGREPTIDAPSPLPVADLSQHKELRSSSMRPQSARASTAKPVVTKPANSVKPRSKKRQQQSYLSKTMKIPFANGQDQPNDEHLAWAARISDFYRAKRDLDDG